MLEDKVKRGLKWWKKSCSKKPLSQEKISKAQKKDQEKMWEQTAAMK